MLNFIEGQVRYGSYFSCSKYVIFAVLLHNTMEKIIAVCNADHKTQVFNSDL